MSYVKQSPVASSVPFDNTSNGFDAQDVQAAIEEIREAISSIGSSPVDFSFQSAISVNTDSSFSAGNKGVAVKAGRDTLLDVLGSARLGQNASLIVDSNGSVRVRSHS